MRKFYEKSEICFAVMWIIIYVVVMGNLRNNFGDDSIFSLIGLLSIAIVVTLFILKNDLTEKYGFIRVKDSFVTIPGAYGTLNDFMRTNGLTHVENEVIPCFETDGESMDVYIACERKRARRLSKNCTVENFISLSCILSKK